MGKIIALAIILRLFLLGSVPASLNWDEVSQGYSAYSIARAGADEWGNKLPIFFRSYGEWKSAVYIYLLVPLVKIFGLSATVVRLPSALAGVISVYLIYLICKKLYSHQVGIWAAFLMAVTPWSFFLSRPGFEANLALTLVLGGLYLFLTQKYLFSALLFGLAPHTYNSAKVVVPLLVIYLVWSTKLYKNLKSMLMIFVTLAIFAFPLLLNLFSGESQARYNQVSILSDGKALENFYALRKPLPPIAAKVVINKVTYFTYKFVDNTLSYFSPGFLAWHGGSHSQQSLPYHGVLYASELALVIIGVFALFAAKSKNSLPFVLIALGIIPAAMTRDPEHVLRSTLAIPGFIILAALGYDYLSKIQFKYLKLGVAILILEILIYLVSYFTWYAPSYARDWQYGYPAVSSYLKNHEGEYDHVVVTKWFGEPQLFLAFYGKWDPVWYQAENKNNLKYETTGKMWLDQLESYSLGKYTFKYISWADESRDKKTLYIGKFDDFPGATPLEAVYYPDGTVAFLIVAGDR
ncbi:MAG: glycosyltransferase family 39 protein [Microgenomates group bacterium]